MLAIILTLIVGIVIGFAVAALIRLTNENSINGWENSCTGDCNQGRNCNCVGKK